MTRVANCLVQLIKEVDKRWPDRPTASDGTFGDAAHQARVSDHNPNSHGVVTAWDITTAPWSPKFALWLANEKNTRVKYVIWDHGIWEPGKGWSRYTGEDPHTNHIHLSVSANPAEYDRTDSWHVDDFEKEDDMTPDEHATLKHVEKMLAQLTAPRRPDHKDIDPDNLSLADLYTLIENKG